MILLQLQEATAAAAGAAADVTKKISAANGPDDGLHSLLWFLALALGIMLVLLVVGVIAWLLKREGRREEENNKFVAACAAITTPIKDAYAAAESALKLAHAQEIRGNEANHQAALEALRERCRSLEERNKAVDEERRKNGDTLQQAYREITEIVGPFTQSNAVLADKVQQVHTMVQNFVSGTRSFLPPTV